MFPVRRVSVLIDESFAFSDILNKTGEPVMGHPPNTESDLTFDNFLEAVAGSADKKHLKFDFKEWLRL